MTTWKWKMEKTENVLIERFRVSFFYKTSSMQKIWKRSWKRKETSKFQGRVENENERTCAACKNLRLVAFQKPACHGISCAYMCFHVFHIFSLFRWVLTDASRRTTAPWKEVHSRRFDSTRQERREILNKNSWKFEASHTLKDRAVNGSRLQKITPCPSYRPWEGFYVNKQSTVTLHRIRFVSWNRL